MGERNDVRIVTYNGVDGACAAAAVLLVYPKARLFITSAARVGWSLGQLQRTRPLPTQVHVCGLGVWCKWNEVLSPARALRKNGVEILWYCGRGYLDKEHADFERVCTPVFLDASSNTEAVCRRLSIEGNVDAQRLIGLARYDSNNDRGKPGRPPTEDQQFWIDFVEASVSQYFKYQDTDAYIRAIYKLAEDRHEKHDEQMVGVYRRYGLKHILTGKSRAMWQLRELISKCARTDEHVLITGQSGIGKEHVAHLLHQGSARGMNPIIPVNCAMFAGNVGLANSVLFGHVKGAFTGALKDREGAFVTADAGVLFLDEVAELPLEVQGKFLRVIEDGWVTREGEDRPVRQVDVRVIAATNRDLPEVIRRGEFRGDLYHRLDTLRIDVPPLREHAEDIEAIAKDTLRSMERETGRRTLTETEMKQLQGYDWPGNVRQLIKVLKRAAYLDVPIADAIADERRLGTLRPGGKGDESDRLWPLTPDAIRPIRDIQREYAARALELNAGNITETAKRLGIAANTLRSYLQSCET